MHLVCGNICNEMSHTHTNKGCLFVDGKASNYILLRAVNSLILKEARGKPSNPLSFSIYFCRNAIASQLALRRWPNVGIGRHRRDRQPTSRQRWYSVACVATVSWHSVGARRLAYRSLPMFCVWTSVVGIKCFSNKCCRSTRLSIHQLHI